MNKLKDEDKEFKRFIGDSYKSQIEAGKQREAEERQRHLDAEKQRLALAQKQLEDEKLLKFQQRVQMRREVEDLLQRKKEQKDFERDMAKMTREEQKQLMEERAKAEVDRENKYKKHFEDCGKLMEERAKMHMESVRSPETQRSRQIQDWILKHETEYQEKLKAKERELTEWRRLVCFLLLNLT